MENFCEETSLKWPLDQEEYGKVKSKWTLKS
jgi:hypothetical protein